MDTQYCTYPIVVLYEWIYSYYFGKNQLKNIMASQNMWVYLSKKILLFTYLYLFLKLSNQIYLMENFILTYQLIY